MIDYFREDHNSDVLVRVRSHFALRARRALFQLFTQVMRPTAECKVLDIGVTPEESYPETNFFEKLYSHTHNLTVASIEDASNLETAYPGVAFVQPHGNRLPFTDSEFDIMFCSAVLEHMGDDDTQKLFLGETLRVGRKFFLTTPNRWFPVDFHSFLPLVHWLPRPAHQWLLRRLGFPFWSQTDNLNLLSGSKLRRLLPPCAQYHLYKYRLFGWPSNLVIYGSSS